MLTEMETNKRNVQVKGSTIEILLYSSKDLFLMQQTRFPLQFFSVAVGFFCSKKFIGTVK